MDLHVQLLLLGGLLLVGLATDELGRRTRLPRVTLLILFGVAVGPSGFDLLPAGVQDWYAFLASAALTMVAFILGGKLSVAALRSNGREIFTVSIVVVLFTAACVGFGLALIGTPLLIALLLAGIATSTAPAATRDVVRQCRARGHFTDTLQGVVAVDDAWGLIVFSLLLVAAKAISGASGIDVLGAGLWELGGAVLVGIAVGLPAALLTGRLRPGEPVQAEALGIVFVCAGLAIWLSVSFLLAGMIAGAIVVNFARHHSRPFHEIEHVEWPFLILFFVLAGASLELDRLDELGAIGAAYLLLRALARPVGGWLGAYVAGSKPAHRTWIGIALVPQAGVALGMALVAASHFPQVGETVLVITIATTIVFELVGPVLTQIALHRVGDVP